MIYTASKTRHAPLWLDYRARGYPIISTWIDEAGATPDFSDLWNRCIAEASQCKALVIYREPEDILKGAWVELGCALSQDTPVFSYGIEEFTIASHRLITPCSSLDEAMALAQKSAPTGV